MTPAERALLLEIAKALTELLCFNGFSVRAGTVDEALRAVEQEVATQEAEAADAAALIVHEHAIWHKLRGKAYRKHFVEAQVKQQIPLQMRLLLRKRGWTPDELAERAELTQGAVSRALNMNDGNLTLNTIIRIASGFDVAFIGRFVPFSTLAEEFDKVSEEDLRMVATFDEEDVEQKEERDADREMGGRVLAAGLPRGAVGSEPGIASGDASAPDGAVRGAVETIPAAPVGGGGVARTTFETEEDGRIIATISASAYGATQEAAERHAWRLLVSHNEFFAKDE